MLWDDKAHPLPPIAAGAGAGARAGAGTGAEANTSADGLSVRAEDGSFEAEGATASRAGETGMGIVTASNTWVLEDGNAEFDPGSGCWCLEPYTDDDGIEVYGYYHSGSQADGAKAAPGWSWVYFDFESYLWLCFDESTEIWYCHEPESDDMGWQYLHVSQRSPVPRIEISWYLFSHGVPVAILANPSVLCCRAHSLS